MSELAVVTYQDGEVLVAFLLAKKVTSYDLSLEQKCRERSKLAARLSIKDLKTYFYGKLSQKFNLSVKTNVRMPIKWTKEL